MAKMINEPPKFHGENTVWKSLHDFLPADWVVYNNQEVKGKEFDICVLIPNKGVLIIDVFALI